MRHNSTYRREQKQGNKYNQYRIHFIREEMMWCKKKISWMSEKYLRQLHT